MSTPEEPSELPADADPEREVRDTVSLVDLIDQFDRDAFHRALKYRDSVFPYYSNRES